MSTNSMIRAAEQPVPPLTVVADRSRPGTTVLCGEFDVATAGLVERAALVPGDSDLTLDLAGVTFIDAAGVGALVQIAAALRARGRTLRLEGATARTRLVFSLVGLEWMLR